METHIASPLKISTMTGLTKLNCDFKVKLLIVNFILTKPYVKPDSQKYVVFKNNSKSLLV